MKKTLLLLVTNLLLLPFISFAQSSADKENIPGHYVVRSLTFDDNKEIRHVDMQYTFNADGTGTYASGKTEKAIKWKVRMGKIKEKSKETGKMEETTKPFLVIADADGFDPTPYEIVELSKKSITLHGDYRDDDSTSPGTVILKKKK